MKDTNCYICGSRDRVTLESQHDVRDTYLDLIGLDYTQADRRICVCRDCGFVYRTPILDQAETALLYRDTYRNNILKRGNADQYFDTVVSLTNAESELFAKVVWLKARVGDRFPSQRALLDIGCGAGMFLYKFLHQLPDWDAAGVEPGRVFGETAGRRSGKPVAIQEYAPGLFGRRFQLITLIQVLEHVEDPAALLVRVHEDLTPDGLVYIEVPSVRDFAVVPPGHDRFMAPHLYFFSPNSVRNMCARAGFSVLESELCPTVRNKVDLRVLCRPDPNVAPLPLLKDEVADVLAERQAFTPNAR